MSTVDNGLAKTKLKYRVLWELPRSTRYLLLIAVSATTIKRLNPYFSMQPYINQEYYTAHQKQPLTIHWIHSHLVLQSQDEKTNYLMLHHANALHLQKY